jgi:uncharacterized membrane protein
MADARAGRVASPAARGAAATIELLATAVWLGGLTVLGAVVAPTIFRNVPAPTSADAMTLVFRRFDTIAMTCAGIVLAIEAWRAFARIDGVARGKLDVARIVVAAAAAALAVGEGMVISPRIAALHAAGAIRGLDELGRQLEAVHRLAETAAKVELALLVALVALNAAGLTRVSRQIKQGESP